MRWTKVRKLVEDSFADSVKDRVTVRTTQYRNGRAFACDCGHGWLTIDGESITHFHTHLSYGKYGTDIHESTDRMWSRNTRLPGQPRWIAPKGHAAVANEDRVVGRLSEPGEFSRYDLALSCWTYLHTRLEESLESPARSFVDWRCSTRRLGDSDWRSTRRRSLIPCRRHSLSFGWRPKGTRAVKPRLAHNGTTRAESPRRCTSSPHRRRKGLVSRDEKL